MSEKRIVKYVRFVVLGILIMLCGNAIAGGGWTLNKNSAFFMLSQRYIGGAYFANQQARIIELNHDFPSFYTTNFYMEYGLVDDCTISLFTPFLSGHRLQSEFGSRYVLLFLGREYNETRWGIGDLDLAIKYRLLNKTDKVALELKAGIPTARVNLRDQSPFALGDGEFNQQLNVHWSRSYDHNLFSSVMIGFNNRTAGFSDEFHFSTEIGITKKRLTAILKTYLLKSRFNGTFDRPSFPGIYSNNLEYFAISPVFLYELGEDRNKGIMLDVGFAPYLRNIIAAPSISVGIYWKPKNLRKL